MADKFAAARDGKPAATAGGADGDAYLDDLLKLANEERQRLVTMVSAVEASGARPAFRFAGNVDPADVAARAAADAKGRVAGGVAVSVQCKPGLPALNADADALVRMLASLVVRASRYAPAGSAVKVTADGPLPYWNTTGVCVRVTADGPAWPEADVASFFTPFSLMPTAPGDVGLELLDAFQTALGHEGDVLAHRGAPGGPGFEIWLPLDPAAVRRPALVDGKLALPPAAA
jgi:K+-sensing histidine kinase KdpD